MDEEVVGLGSCDQVGWRGDHKYDRHPIL